MVPCKAVDGAMPGQGSGWRTDLARKIGSRTRIALPLVRHHARLHLLRPSDVNMPDMTEGEWPTERNRTPGGPTKPTLAWGFGASDLT